MVGHCGACCEGVRGIYMKSASADSTDFFAVRPECQDEVPKTKFKNKPGKTLSARKWQSAFSQDGHLDIAKVLSRIQRGGIHPSIKGVVWEFLLGCYDPKSTFDERSLLRQRRREQYEMWKSECKNMEPTIGSGRIITGPVITEGGIPIQDPSSSDLNNEGPGTPTPDISPRHDGSTSPSPVDSVEKKVLQWKLTLHQIGLDVVRTDRALIFYVNDSNLAKLWDVLCVYAWIDTDIGYCQGMNDLCSPMVILLQNEADAFWCFEHLMRRMRGNFKTSVSSIGVQSQLSTLAEIIKVVDPKLHQHLGSCHCPYFKVCLLMVLSHKELSINHTRDYDFQNIDGGEYLFAFRMLMVLFRRELSFMDAIYLWELMWAMEYNPNIFSQYEDPSTTTNNGAASKGKDKPLKQYGKFERKIVKSSSLDQQAALSVFLMAGVLEAKNKRLLKEATGLDDVVQILNDITGNLDAKKACREALKVHKKYLSKAKKS
ncbi:rab GTPase-activating protein 22-like isoform X2 [Telopea speciosissima]|uniref:rab GTPase-activating protein 22-like isoform X2 n=1 Tax=Telopea speciosissima TaxID=54955 RepID=UPI001CC64662|nr:rab GTPase-activating protein 22-like isoform X2 [Telopea speciosissima]